MTNTLTTNAHGAELDLETICYKGNFLKEVIARIDLVAPIDNLVSALPPKLANTLSEWFPIKEPTDAIAQEFQLSKDGMQAGDAHRFKHWNFFGKEREKQLALSARYVSVTYHKYITFEYLQDEFSRIVDTLAAAFPDTRAQRFGLRYVNVIEDIPIKNPTDWHDYISPALIESTRFFSANYELTRIMQAAEFKFDELELRFQYGMPNPEYPAAIRKPQYVLDLDAYIRTSHKLSESKQHAYQAHKHIQEIFERSIKKALRDRMNEK